MGFQQAEIVARQRGFASIFVNPISVVIPQCATLVFKHLVFACGISLNHSVV